MSPRPTLDHPALSSEPLLSATDLSVRFGSVHALSGVNFELRAGEVQALLGENGAGKSTLIKCLTGVVAPSGGGIRLSGRTIAPTSPHQAESMGIAAVYQEVGLIPHLSIAENICLGREPLRRFWPRFIDWRAVRDRARSVLSRLGLSDLDVDRGVATCSVAVQQMVAIARALDVDARVLILDEPTSSLDREECARLLAVLRQLRGQGMGIIFISHFLDQVEAIADRATILRDGKMVGTFAASGLPRAKLISLMVGREFDAGPAQSADDGRPIGPRAAPILSARGLGRAGALESVDLDVGPGEVVGLAGLLGSGRTETARLLFGADTLTHGEITVKGMRVRLTSPRDAIALGMALTPENRKTEGLNLSLSVSENILLALRAKRGLFSRVPQSEQRRIVAEFIGALGIKAPHAHTPISLLSGGNQQKALLARWLATEPDVLILDEPTRGIDIAAKADVLREIERLRFRGMSVVFISSELEEMVRACARIVVLRDRRSIAGIADGPITQTAMLQAIAGPHG